jgi:uncharacterized protein (TIGR03437 family)
MRIPVAILVILFSKPVLADLSQTVTLSAGSSLNLDTGTIIAPRTVGTPDILFDATGITPQGNATATNVGVGAYNVLSVAVLTFTPGFSKSTIPTRELVVNDAFAVRTNGDHFTKLKVNAISAASITLEFVTYGVGATAAGTPTITKVLNNSSQIPPGFPNSGVAPSSIFIVQGNALADAAELVLQSSAAPGLPLTLNGATLSVTVAGVTVRPPIYYTSPGQIAALLPARTPIGTGTITVTHGGVASAPAPIQVVPAAVGFNMYNGKLAVATDGATGALLTFTNSATPGQVIVLWATGLGSDPADSDSVFSSSPNAVNTPMELYVGGVHAAILYQGSAGYPGVNQINITIPTGAPAGCWVPVAAITGAVVSNVVTIPINPGGGTCTDTLTGLTGNQIAPPGTQTIRTGLVSLIQSDNVNSRGERTVSSNANAAFQRYAGIYQPTNSVSLGGCILNDLTPAPLPSFTGLDPGTITLTGASGTTVALASQGGIRGAFFANLPAGFLPASGGTFSFRGSGGADVGSFTTVFTLSNPLLTWDNASAAAAVDRTRGLLVTWSGGNAGSFVFITGTSVVPGTTNSAGYTCAAPVEARQFTVPSYILLGLPPGSGGTEVQNYITAPLSASGLDIAMGIGVVSYSVPSSYSNGSGLSR